MDLCVIIIQQGRKASFHQGETVMKKITAILCVLFLLPCLLPASAGAEEAALTVAPGAGQSSAAPVQEGTWQGTYTPGSGWITFTTGPEAGAEYTLSLENTTPAGSTLYAYLYDDFGFEVAPVKFSGNRDNDQVFIQAESGGRRAAGLVNTLEPDTAYYLMLESTDPVDFVLTVKGPVAGTAASPADPAASRVNMEPAAAKDAAAPLELNQKIYSALADGEAWFSFTTGPEGGKPCRIMATNMQAGSGKLQFSLLDGENQKIAINTIGTALIADDNGRTSSFTVKNLTPDTTYYLHVTPESNAKGNERYSLCVCDGEMPDTEIRPALNSGDDMSAYSNMNDAPMAAFRTKYTEKYSGGMQWIAFRTGSDPAAVYHICLQNTGAGKPLYGYLADEYGGELNTDNHHKTDLNSVRILTAGEDGRTSSCSISLSPDTTYYLGLNSEDKCRYSLAVFDDVIPFDTEERSTPSPEDGIRLAANMNEAPLVQPNVKYTGTSSAENRWVAFRTGKEEDVSYTVALENTDPGGDPVFGTIYTESGYPLPGNNNQKTDAGNSSVSAYSQGRTSTVTLELDPDSTYYVWLSSEKPVDFLFWVTDPTAELPASAGDETAEDPEEQAEIHENTNQSWAAQLPLDTRVCDHYESGSRWYCFTTNDNGKAEYRITAVNRTIDTKPLTGYLFDENGYPLRRSNSADGGYGIAFNANWDGTASTGLFPELKTGTTYYILVECESEIDFSLKVSVDSGEKKGFRTSSTLADALTAVPPDESIQVGSNQNDAVLIKTDTQVRYRGVQRENSYGWLAFRTGEALNGTYTLSLRNMTPGSQPVEGYLVDEFGDILQPTRISASKYAHDVHMLFYASEDEEACTAEYEERLKPNTVYYIRLFCKGDAEYELNIVSPEGRENNNIIAEETVEPTPEPTPEPTEDPAAAEEPVETAEPTEAPTPAPTPEPTPEPAPEPVFEVPFELNETQVRFIANQAEFLDRAAACSACKPVAEAILSHPGQKILLAGTTATMRDPRQESCEQLSLDRANAVKKLLVEQFGVPEDQLLTVGLGFLKDPFERGQDRDRRFNFIESEARKNRRVVLIDAASPIAQQILNP